ncbi:MAG: hypothetical protein ACYDA9_06115 [Terriglobia bacterium]
MNLQRESSSKKRHSAHQTQWAAQFAVASELCERGYQVAFTMGNHPVIDLMVLSPSGTQFAIDVKGQYKRNFWPVRQKATTEKLFYVLAFVPEARENSFFILTQDQANEGIVAAESPEFPGIDSKFAEQFKDKWDSLPK